MKIAFIVGFFPCISETFILNQISGLMELGHDVEIFSIHKSTEATIHGTVNELDLMRKVHYFPAVPKNKFFRIIKGKYLFFKNFLKSPCNLFKSINIFSLDKDIYSLKVLYHIIPFLNKKFDIIHSHFGNNGEIGVFLRKGGMKGMLVTTFYGYDLSTHVNLFGENVYKELFKCGDLFLPICDYFRKKIVNMSCDPLKIRIHPVGIDMDTFRFKTGTTGKNKKVQILTVGRLIEKKGYAYSIIALKHLLQKGREFYYTIVGDGPLKGELKQLVEDSGLKDHVRFAGSVNLEELPGYYKNTDIFLLPSITAEDEDEEGTPTVLLEAQAVGIPVVSTFHSGIPEIVDHEKSGYLIKEKDIDKLINYLDILISDDELRKQTGMNGRRLVEKKYDIKVLCSILTCYYTELLNR